MTQLQAPSSWISNPREAPVEFVEDDLSATHSIEATDEIPRGSATRTWAPPSPP